MIKRKTLSLRTRHRFKVSNDSSRGEGKVSKKIALFPQKFKKFMDVGRKLKKKKKEKCLFLKIYEKTNQEGCFKVFQVSKAKLYATTILLKV